MKLKTIAIYLIGLFLITTTITGCVLGNEGTLNYKRTTTVGQELMDLEKAKHTLTEEEYQKLKKQIMKGGPFPRIDHEDKDD